MQIDLRAPFLLVFYPAATIMDSDPAVVQRVWRHDEMRKIDIAAIEAARLG
ncbi:hypothetical protein [Acidovorax sp. SRB_24]|uniref:hypothetical protein n=1 Tax=Acidovorax sp. SRB_24 TaxID=1962700 RepID=UPI00145E3D2C|nr:hypothetical protein [Acidovorax sp. SRB_24]